MVIGGNTLVTWLAVLGTQRLLQMANGAILVLHKEDHIVILAVWVFILCLCILLQCLHFLLSHSIILIVFWLALLSIWLNDVSKIVLFTVLISIRLWLVYSSYPIIKNILWTISIHLKLRHLIRGNCHYGATWILGDHVSVCLSCVRYMLIVLPKCGRIQIRLKFRELTLGLVIILELILVIVLITILIFPCWCQSLHLALNSVICFLSFDFLFISHAKWALPPLLI